MNILLLFLYLNFHLLWGFYVVQVIDFLEFIYLYSYISQQINIIII